MKNIVIYWNDGSKKEIRGVENITWSERNIYIDTKQHWNETNVSDDPYVFRLAEVSQILINFN